MVAVISLERPFRTLVLLFLCILLPSCASSYKSYNLREYQYHSRHNILDSLSISYAPDHQRISDNGWYARKELKYGMTALAVRIENSSSTSLTIGQNDLRATVGNETRRLIAPQEYSSHIKQRVGIHLLHTLYGPWVTVSTVDQYGKTGTECLFYTSRRSNWNTECTKGQQSKPL